MPRERAVSEVKEPHAISLKVLRLSRPLLAEQHTLPLDDLAAEYPELRVLSEQSHAYPTDDLNNSFILSPLVMLPPAFGTVSVGECFSCCLSANNETPRKVTAVRISASMETPTTDVELELSGADESDESEVGDLEPAESVQKIVKFDLREEGNHVLAVTVRYTEGPSAPPKSGEELEPTPPPLPPRTRTFRKLYQFLAQQCLTVRSKTGALPNGCAILEAQLENVATGHISLESVRLDTADGWTAQGLNWDDSDPSRRPLLRARDVEQVAFLVSPTVEGGGEGDGPKDKDGEKGKRVLGQLTIEWRTAGGDHGILSTGYLSV